MTEIEVKTTSITGLATTNALNVVENKIASVIDLVEKQAKESDINTECLPTSDRWWNT